MLINVSRWDIWFGRRRDARRCPIARAIRKQLPKGSIVIVDPIIITINDHDHDTPIVARDFMRAFDEGSKVKPITFEIND